MGAASGGPAASVRNLCEALARLGVPCGLLTAAPSGGDPKLPDPGLVRTRVAKQISLGLPRSYWSPGFGRKVRECAGEWGAALVHSHGLWSQPNHAASAAARRLGLPLVISPRGMLTPWALRHKAWKKRLAWGLYQRRDLGRAAAIHATADDEARGIRMLGLGNPIAVIPNGIEIPAWREPANGTEPRTVLFLSRIHPKKGLLNLVEAWSAIRPDGWRLRIAGPDEDNHRSDVERAIEEANVGGTVTFAGSLYGERKWEAYRAADLFVLPSFSENFGLVVGEALAAGVPVITTRGTPWRELETRRCGWWVPIGVEPLAEALRDAMALSDAERREMGLRGRRLIEEKYTWESVARRMKAVYEWVLGGGSIPACVMTG